MEEKKGLHDQSNPLQIRIGSLKVSKCALQETLLSSSHRSKASEDQAVALIIHLAADLKCKFNSQPRRVSTVKMRVLVGKNGIHKLGMEMCGRTLMKLDFDPSDSEGFNLPASAENVSPHPCLRELIDIPQCSIIVVCRPITKLKAKQAPRGEIKSVVLEEVRYTTKELNEFLIHSSRHLRNMCGNAF